MTYELGYEGRPAAWVDAHDVDFAPWIEERSPDDPLRRFVAAMCEFLHEYGCHHPELPGRADAAAFYARVILMPLEEWLPRQGWSDDALAEHFNVPLREARWRRLDVALLNVMTDGHQLGRAF